VVGSGQLALVSPKSISTYCEGQQTRLPKKIFHCRCVIFNRKFLALEVIPVVYVRTNMTSPKKRRHQMHDANFSAYCCSEVRWQSRNPSQSQASKKRVCGPDPLTLMARSKISHDPGVGKYTPVPIDDTTQEGNVVSAVDAAKRRCLLEHRRQATAFERRRRNATTRRCYDAGVDGSDANCGTMKGPISIVYCPTMNQIADGLTRPLPGQQSPLMVRADNGRQPTAEAHSVR
jgi:hypothetical protein